MEFITQKLGKAVKTAETYVNKKRPYQTFYEALKNENKQKVDEQQKKNPECLSGAIDEINRKIFTDDLTNICKDEDRRKKFIKHGQFVFHSDRNQGACKDKADTNFKALQNLCEDGADDTRFLLENADLIIKSIALSFLINVMQAKDKDKDNTEKIVSDFMDHFDKTYDNDIKTATKTIITLLIDTIKINYQSYLTLSKEEQLIIQEVWVNIFCECIKISHHSNQEGGNKVVGGGIFKALLAAAVLALAQGYNIQTYIGGGIAGAAATAAVAASLGVVTPLIVAAGGVAAVGGMASIEGLSASALGKIDEVNRIAWYNLGDKAMVYGRYKEALRELDDARQKIIVDTEAEGRELSIQTGYYGLVSSVPQDAKMSLETLNQLYKLTTGILKQNKSNEDINAVLATFIKQVETVVQKTDVWNQKDVDALTKFVNGKTSYTDFLLQFGSPNQYDITHKVCKQTVSKYFIESGLQKLCTYLNDNDSVLTANLVDQFSRNVLENARVNGGDFESQRVTSAHRQLMMNNFLFDWVGPIITILVSLGLIVRAGTAITSMVRREVETGKQTTREDILGDSNMQTALVDNESKQELSRQAVEAATLKNVGVKNQQLMDKETHLQQMKDAERQRALTTMDAKQNINERQQKLEAEKELANSALKMMEMTGGKFNWKDIQLELEEMQPEIKAVEKFAVHESLQNIFASLEREEEEEREGEGEGEEEEQRNRGTIAESESTDIKNLIDYFELKESYYQNSQQELELDGHRKRGILITFKETLSRIKEGNISPNAAKLIGVLYPCLLISLEDEKIPEGFKGYKTEIKSIINKDELTTELNTYLGERSNSITPHILKMIFYEVLNYYAILTHFIDEIFLETSDDRTEIIALKKNLLQKYKNLVTERYKIFIDIFWNIEEKKKVYITAGDNIIKAAENEGILDKYESANNDYTNYLRDEWVNFLNINPILKSKFHGTSEHGDQSHTQEIVEEIFDKDELWFMVIPMVELFNIVKNKFSCFSNNKEKARFALFKLKNRKKSDRQIELPSVPSNLSIGGKRKTMKNKHKKTKRKIKKVKNMNRKTKRRRNKKTNRKK